MLKQVNLFKSCVVPGALCSARLFRFYNFIEDVTHHAVAVDCAVLPENSGETTAILPEY